MENMIKGILMRKRDIEAESRVLHRKSIDDHVTVTPDLIEKMKCADEQLARIEYWLLLLSEDESFVVTRHLIDGIDIARIAYEYKERWGEELAKTERTIRSYQSRALKKIAKFEMNH